MGLIRGNLMLSGYLPPSLRVVLRPPSELCGKLCMDSYAVCLARYLSLDNFFAVGFCTFRPFLLQLYPVTDGQ